MVLAIDPGNKESAYVWIDERYQPKSFGKVDNGEILTVINKHYWQSEPVVVEMIASYGMPVGKEVFETCLWIGRFSQVAITNGATVEYVYRKDVKVSLCGTTKAKDANIRQALIDRFGDVGTKARPGWFYGFKADVWAAYAVGVTYLDKKKFEERI